jgi:hypothetical protein
MKLLDVPIGLLINFHELVLKNGICRMILRALTKQKEPEPATFRCRIPESPVFVFFVAFCRKFKSCGFEILSAPAWLAATLRGFTFCVAAPSSSAHGPHGF